MRIRIVVVFILALFAGGCRSSSPTVDIIQPEITIQQLRESSFVMQYPGRLTIFYSLEITNRSGETIELESVQLRTVGDAPFTLQSSAVPIRRTIAPEATEVVELPFVAVSEGGQRAPAVPVTVRGIARFDSAAGRFRTFFTQLIRQPSHTGRE